MIAYIMASVRPDRDGAGWGRQGPGAPPSPASSEGEKKRRRTNSDCAYIHFILHKQNLYNINLFTTQEFCFPNGSALQAVDRAVGDRAHRGARKTKRLRLSLSGGWPLRVRPGGGPGFKAY
jgi:hypothetical protein